jgi:hypothetical protein
VRGEEGGRGREGGPRMERESRFWGSRFFTVIFTDLRCVFMLLSTPAVTEVVEAGHGDVV